MHLAAMVERADHVCCRYRVSAFAEHWRKAGHTLDLISWPRRWWDWLSLGKILEKADLVIWQRRLLSFWQIYFLRRSSRRLVFDFDDAVFLRDSFSRRGLFSVRRQRRFAALVQAVDGVVAGNSFLATQTLRFRPEQKVRVVPTCVDPDRYPLARHVPSGPEVRCQMTWIGSSSTLQSLEKFRPYLEEIGRRISQMELKVICDRFLSLDHLPVIPCPWSEAREGEDLAGADIGISWLPDDLWSQGKCGLKILQYMAAGLPVVANPVGVHREMVRHGETGFLVHSPQDWLQAIEALARQPGLRKRMGLAGRRRVEEIYSVQAGAAQWQAFLRQLVLRKAG